MREHPKTRADDDADGDGLTNQQENALGTDPNDDDSDDDGDSTMMMRMMMPALLT